MRKEETLRQTLGRERDATYRLGITAAQHAWSANNVPQAEQFLADCPEGARGWEWLYLHRLCHGGTFTLDVNAFPVRTPGRWLVTRRLDEQGHALVVLEAAGGREVAVLRGLTEEGPTVALSPNGQRLATVSGKKDDRTPHQVQVWDVATARVECTLQGHAPLVESVVFSPDGRHLATAAHPYRNTPDALLKAEVQFWDPANG